MGVSDKLIPIVHGGSQRWTLSSPHLTEEFLTPLAYVRWFSV
jgi:hypothetical protein